MVVRFEQSINESWLHHLARDSRSDMATYLTLTVAATGQGAASLSHLRDEASLYNPGRCRRAERQPRASDRLQWSAPPKAVFCRLYRKASREWRR